MDKLFMLRSRLLIFAVLLLGIGLGSCFIFWKKERIDLDSVATVFPSPRELQPFKLQVFSPKQQSLPFTQEALAKHWTLLFFGFTHCSEVCPTTLATLKEVYQDLHLKHPGFQVVFVSLDPKRDEPQRLQTYLAHFNKDFIGLSGTTEQLENVKQQFGIFSEEDNNADLNHTGSLLLLNPKGQWVALLSYGLPREKLRAALEQLI